MQTTLLHDSTVLKRIDFGHGYFELQLECPDLADSMSAGQFVNVRVGDDQSSSLLLRRPFSSFDLLRDARGRATGISLLGHVVGAGTAWMARAEAGAKVSLHGPLGHAFIPPEDEGARILMVGGGIGLAPFLHAARQWGSAKKGEGGGQRDLVLLAGGRSQRDLTFLKRFTDAGTDLLLATEDGTAGVKGLVTELLEAELEALGGQPAMVLTCGPWKMMAAVSALCESADQPVYACLEAVMACGYGVCNGCVTRVREADGWRYAKVCVEGTIFEGASVLW